MFGDSTGFSSLNGFSYSLIRLTSPFCTWIVGMLCSLVTDSEFKSSGIFSGGRASVVVFITTLDSRCTLLARFPTLLARVTSPGCFYKSPKSYSDSGPLSTETSQLIIDWVSEPVPMLFMSVVFMLNSTHACLSGHFSRGTLRFDEPSKNSSKFSLTTPTFFSLSSFFKATMIWANLSCICEVVLSFTRLDRSVSFSLKMAIGLVAVIWGDCLDSYRLVPHLKVTETLASKGTLSSTELI